MTATPFVDAGSYDNLENNVVFYFKFSFSIKQFRKKKKVFLPSKLRWTINVKFFTKSSSGNRFFRSPGPNPGVHRKADISARPSAGRADRTFFVGEQQSVNNLMSRRRGAGGHNALLYYCYANPFSERRALLLTWGSRVN